MDEKEDVDKVCSEGGGGGGVAGGRQPKKFFFCPSGLILV